MGKYYYFVSLLTFIEKNTNVLHILKFSIVFIKVLNLYNLIFLIKILIFLYISFAKIQKNKKVQDS